MDYKQKHLIAPNWTRSQFFEINEEDPFDQISCVRELTTTDGELQLLLFQSHLDDSTGLVTFYAIEAPPHCPTRKAFEWGDITWTEFWGRAPWLLEVSYIMDGDEATSRYIEPSGVTDDTKKLFERLGHRGPYILKFEQVKIHVTAAKCREKNLKRAEQNYRDFVTRHAKKLKERLPEEFSDDASTNWMDDWLKKFTA